MLQIKIINNSGYDYSEPQTPGSSGIDLRSTLSSISIGQGQTVVIPTGLCMEIPEGYEGQIRSRSGLAANHNLFVLNSPGVIDSDFRGELKVILTNLSDKEYKVLKGDRIAQITFFQFEKVEFETVQELLPTDRGSGGFGSTGR